MKKIVIGLAAVTGLLLMVAGWAGISPAYVLKAPAMLAGMGAKLSCSGHYVSGLTKPQAIKDLQSYSAILGWLDIHFDDRAQLVEADFLGLENRRARYRPGLGCALEIGETAPLDQLANQLASEQLTPEYHPIRGADWPQGDSAGDIDPELQQKLDQLRRSDNSEGLQTRALVVIYQGKLVAESYAPGFDPYSRLLGWSMAKSVTALLTGRLEMLGLLDPEQLPVFDQWANDARRQIHWQDLLHMSSGLNFPEDYEPGAGATDMLFNSSRASDLPLMAALVHPPGELFEYSSGTTNLLSRKLYELTGNAPQRHHEFLRQQLIVPLGLQDFVMETDPSGIPVGSSYLYASARDWARVGQLMLNGGELNGYRLVDQTWVNRALQPNQSENKKSYGYQFWLNRGDVERRWPKLPADSYAALGNRKQVMMMVPSMEAVIVRLGWTTGSYPTNDNMAEILSWLTESSDRLK